MASTQQLNNIRVLIALGAVCCTATALAAPPVPVAPPPSTASESVTPAKQAAALELARLFSPTELIVKGELEQFDRHFRASFAKMEGVAELEAEYPGLMERMYRVMRPLLEKQMRSGMGPLHARIGEKFAAGLTSEDIADLTAFYRSPEGRAMMEKMAASIDAKALYEKVAADPEAPISTRDIASNVRGMASRAVDKFEDSERDAMSALMRRPAFVHLASLQADIRQIMADFVNNTTPEEQKELDRVVETEVAAHINELEKQRASK